METKADSPVASAAPDVSLIRGGPFYRAQEVTRLIGPNDWNLGRRITFAITVGWLPLILIPALFNRGIFLEVLKDYRIVSRMLIAVPVLLLGQVVMEMHFRESLQHIRTARLLEGPDLASMDEILARLIRLRDSVLPEVIIVLLVIVRSVTVYQGLVADVPWLAYRTESGLHLTLVGWYAVLVSASIFQFLVLLTLWKWLLWTVFTFRLSKLNLRLIPTHPDENGGLGFLGLTPLAFAPLAFATTIVIGAVWRDEILRHGAHLRDYMGPGIALFVIIFLLGLGPLVFFVPRLAALRRKGILQYAILGQIHSVEFHQKWVLDPARNEAELIDAPEVSTLCDYGQAYDRIEKLNPFPTGKGALVALVLAVAIPSLPTVLAEIPITVLLKDLLSALK